jgi:hypothetical protein
MHLGEGDIVVAVATTNGKKLDEPSENGNEAPEEVEETNEEQVEENGVEE